MIRRMVFLGVAACLILGVSHRSALALAPFKKAFQKRYVDPSDSEAFKAAFKKASCNTCHVKGKKKDVRNPYGDELAKLIEGDANARIKAAAKEGGSEGRKAETEKILKELEAAFAKVETLKSPTGETFGDRLKNGLLPVDLPEVASN